jgi:formylglycine-generating enzyme required for sulfatase activity
VGRFEVTFDEWEFCVADNGCAGNKSPSDQGWGKGRRPLINVSWNDAKEYVAWLTRVTGKPYRLLSEAEWEYTARAGTTSAYFWGDVIGSGGHLCNGCLSSGTQTVPVGSFEPNSFGLYDMHGNVWEWVEDCWSPDYSRASSNGSVRMTEDCMVRVLRGGSWDSIPRNLRAASRSWDRPDVRLISVGFRVARTLLPANP